MAILALDFLPINCAKKPAFAHSCRRQSDLKGGSLPGSTFQQNGASMLLDDIVTDVQAETGPLTIRLGGKKRLENLFLNFRCHARAIVADHQLDLLLA